jgi:hypothetical protein
MQIEGVSQGIDDFLEDLKGSAYLSISSPFSAVKHLLRRENHNEITR